MNLKQIDKLNLLGLDQAQIATWMQSNNEAAYKAKQVLQWIYQRNESDYAVMHDLSKSLRFKLSEQTTLSEPELIDKTIATDETQKFIFDVEGSSIETVWIPEEKRRTLCMSSQAGCALACTFCLTGKQGFEKNLNAAQIMGQFTSASRLTQKFGNITNVVFMGMGEPLLNLENVIPVLKILTSDYAYKLSRRKVTVSTAGVIPGMDILKEEIPVALAVSLHSADDELRSELVPLNKRYPLTDLIEACHRYLEHAPRDFITFEYVLLDQVNDSLSLARDLVRLLKKIPGKVNLIPFNPFPDAPYVAPSRNRIMAFRDELNKGGIITTIRKQRGDDILAACGQLAGKVKGKFPSSGRIAKTNIPIYET